MVGFRENYKNGIESFYKNNCNNYINPHFDDIKKTLNYISNIKLNSDPILDLCAGSGEITLGINDLFANEIIGSDPFTFDLYKKNTNKVVFDWSFDDIMNGCMENYSFSIIFCSYALHLCSKSKIKLVCLELSRRSKYLCIISPHKKPHISENMGWKLKNTNKYKKIHMRFYDSLTNY
ncbi:Hypothetical protein KVN_LOCUS34 [uncultured virus]|nr:Hypothetical protein KVN_LOCUS34 [uncultured virus]